MSFVCKTDTRSALTKDQMGFVPPRVIGLFADLAPTVELPAGVMLVMQGACQAPVYLLESGTVTAFRLDGVGREVVADVRVDKWLLGTMWAVQGRPAAVSLRTSSACRVRCIPQASFIKAISASVELMWGVLQIQSDELVAAVERVASIACLSGRQRLELMLWSAFASNKTDNNLRRTIRLPCSQVELARRLAMTPQHLSDLTRKLESEGIVQRQRGCLVVLKPECLWRGEPV